jgi:hypothetical protein
MKRLSLVIAISLTLAAGLLLGRTGQGATDHTHHVALPPTTIGADAVPKGLTARGSEAV